MKGQDCNYHCFVHHSGKQAFPILFLSYCLVDQEKLIALFAYKKQEVISLKVQHFIERAKEEIKKRENKYSSNIYE